LFPIGALQAPVWETIPGIASQPESSRPRKTPQTIAETPVTARPTMSELISNDPS